MFCRTVIVQTGVRSCTILMKAEDLLLPLDIRSLCNRFFSGDSRAVIQRSGDALALTSDHKPDRDDEAVGHLLKREGDV